MIVIASKTEITLRDDLQKLVKRKPRQRCFFIQFSKTEIDRDSLFETFLATLSGLPNSYMARIYLCRDKDILILMDGFMQRQFLDFIKTLSIKLNQKDISDLIEIFELGLNWDKVENIYQTKLNIIAQERETEIENQRKKKADENMRNAFSDIAPDRLQTLQGRRDQRTNPIVMIADDDQLSRTLAGNVLRSDFDLAFAAGGAEAIKAYVDHAPDILFLDIGMPDIGGYEVLVSLFRIDADAHIIMFSGRKDQANIVASLEKGAKGFLGKPFTRDELYTHVLNSPFVQEKQYNAA